MYFLYTMKTKIKILLFAIEEQNNICFSDWKGSEYRPWLLGSWRRTNKQWFQEPAGQGGLPAPAVLRRLPETKGPGDNLPPLK